MHDRGDGAESGPRRTLLISSIAAIAIAALLVFGNWLYWVGEGRPGTPSEFRDRVARTGLVVAWTNNGHSAGEGLVTTACGPRAVSVVAIDDTLWLSWDEQRAALTTASAEAFRSCQLR